MVIIRHFIHSIWNVALAILISYFICEILTISTRNEMPTSIQYYYRSKLRHGLRENHHYETKLLGTYHNNNYTIRTKLNSILQYITSPRYHSTNEFSNINILARVYLLQSFKSHESLCVTQ